MRLDKDWIRGHIPHQGHMCLLDEVLEWDSFQSRCRSGTHRSPDNPLRSFGQLGAACGIEYAAQTMAVHGALVAEAAGSVAPPGFLASVRAVRLQVGRLDDVEHDLITLAKRVVGDAGTALYEFSVFAGERLLLGGRAAIAFNVISLERS